jgi:RsmE family RNA methyltransferase
MNAFLLHAADIDSSASCWIDLRLQKQERSKKYLPGTLLKACLRGGQRLWLKVLSQEGDLLHVHVVDRIPAPAKPDIIAIVGVSRPQTMKKVIHTAQVCGVDRLFLVRAAEAQKSYFESEALQPEHIDKEIDLAMAQAWDPIPCRVHVRERFRPFLEDELPSLIQESTLCLLADVQARPWLPSERPPSPPAPLIVSIGPEAGWNTHEKTQFEKAGFAPISAGERILRVETALAFLLGMLSTSTGPSGCSPE